MERRKGEGGKVKGGGGQKPTYGPTIVINYNHYYDNHFNLNYYYHRFKKYTDHYLASFLIFCRTYEDTLSSCVSFSYVVDRKYALYSGSEQACDKYTDVQEISLRV